MTKPLRILKGCVVVGAAAVLLAACGGGGSSAADPLRHEGLVSALETSEVAVVTAAAGNAANYSSGGNSITRSSNGSSNTTTDTAQIEVVNGHIYRTFKIGGTAWSSEGATEGGFPNNVTLRQTDSNTAVDESVHDSFVRIVEAGSTRAATKRLSDDKYVGYAVNLFTATDSDGYAVGSYVASGFWSILESDDFSAIVASSYVETGVYVDGTAADVSTLPASAQVRYAGNGTAAFGEAHGFDDNAVEMMVNFSGNNTSLSDTGTTFLGGEIGLNAAIPWDATTQSFHANDVLNCASGASVCASIAGSSLDAKFYGEDEVNANIGAPDFLGGVFSATGIGTVGGGTHAALIGSFATIEQND